MKVVFKIKSKGVQSEHTMEMNTTVNIGRSRSAQISLQDEKISGNHCSFFLKRDRLELTDKDSKNGTYLNGIRIEQSEVFIGDQIRVGDTLITIEEDKMSPDSVDILTFPGPKKDRIDYALKADFTGARIQNQQYHERIQKTAEAASHEKEVFLRLKAKSKIRLDKHELRARYKMRSLIATMFDGVLIVFFFVFPIFVFSKQLIPAILLGAGVVSAVSFFFITFKKMRFTLGEQITGIEDLYKKQ
ncbi:FHA domain-containing protein [Peredibacter starrii]|uniref:FHA domain-containing protein n=1 Tax=Peredibacter starrii TaxID=28202 RepID=A0AAX4HQ21_9BACT|nr:FHA domain-containing protein [Peredibacter starrii]WPU65312.1 FHA domain-containing protein [Peredibacter starrii]